MKTKLFRTHSLRLCAITLAAVITFAMAGCDNGSGPGGSRVPAAPRGLTATAVSSSRINLSWNAVAGAAGYYVYANTSSGGTYTNLGTVSSNGAYSYDLPANATRYYRVTAYNIYGESGYSNTASATTFSSSGGYAAPSVPTGVSATAASSTSITISWYSVSSAIGYYIYRSTSAYGTYIYLGTTTSLTYTNTGLSASTTYYYKISAYNSGGESAESSYASATTGGSSTHSHTWGSYQSNATQHWRVCTSCYEESARANHGSGNTCSTCGYSSSGGGGHSHSGGDWQYNASQHWRVCTSCYEQYGRASHSGNPCGTCGYSSATSDFTFDKGNGRIIKYNGSASIVVIPSQIDGVTVREIGTGAFANNTTLTGVTIPDTVTRISDDAFLRCTGLTSVTIPASVASIRPDAFIGCTALISVTFQGTPSLIGSLLFPGNLRTKFEYATGGPGTYTRPSGGETWTKQGGSDYDLHTNGTIVKYNGYGGSISIPSQISGVTVISIGESAFSNNTNITGVTIPSTVTRIDSWAFYNCTGLTSVTIPASVASVGSNAFNFCSALTSITIHANISIGNNTTWPGDFRAKYNAGGPGTYTRPSGGNWTKQY